MRHSDTTACAPALLLAFGLLAGAPVLSADLPDLAVHRESMALADGALSVTIVNIGSAAVEGFAVGVTRTPPEPAGILRGGRHVLQAGRERGCALWAEDVEPGTVTLHVQWAGDRAELVGGGEMQVIGAAGYEVVAQEFEADDRFYAGADGVFRWQCNMARGDPADLDGFELRLSLAPGADPLIRITAHTDGLYHPEWVWLGTHRAFNLPAKVRLSQLTAANEAPAMAVQTYEGTLRPGESCRMELRVPEAEAQQAPVFVVVDPHQALDELRRGNNIAMLKRRPNIHAVQLHSHSPLGAADGSLDSHLYHAAASGTEVIYVTDDDWRVALFSYADAFDLHAPDLTATVNVGAESFLQRLVETRRSPDMAVTLRTELYPERAGERFLQMGYRVYAGSEPGIKEHRLRWEAARQRLAYPLLAGVALGLDVHPPDDPSTAALVVRVGLSVQPEGGRDRLTYVIGGSISLIEGLERGTGEPVIAMPWPSQEWGTVTFDLSGDARRLSRHGDDNGITGITFGVIAEEGEGWVGLDSLTIHTQVRGDELLEALARQVIAYPNLAVRVAPAASYYPPRIGIIGPNGSKLDYSEVDPAEYTRLAVAQAMEQGGLAVIHHPFGSGAADGEEAAAGFLAESWLRAGFYGAELLEVGYRSRGGYDLARHTALLGRALKAGTYVVGVGATGAMGGALSRLDNNFLTWVVADSTAPEALIRGLAAGRAFFGDPLICSTSVELATPEGFEMGDIVLTDQGEHTVRARFDCLPPDSTAYLVVDGERVAEVEAGGQGGAVLTEAAVRTHDEGVVVWAESVDREGLPIVLSNPIVFQSRALTGKPLPPDRGGVSVLGVIARDIEGFAVSEVQSLGDSVLISGTGRGGRMTLDFSQSDPPRDVRQVSAFGVASAIPQEKTGDLTQVRDIEGPVSIQIRWPSERPNALEGGSSR